MLETVQRDNIALSTVPMPLRTASHPAGILGDRLLVTSGKHVQDMC
jgi:hypothetical protein